MDTTSRDITSPFTAKDVNCGCQWLICGRSTAPTMLQGRGGRRCFLSIGIQDYAFRPLKHAEKDAEILAFKFQTRGLAENSWEFFETLQRFGINHC